jgi:Tfp pilus assembly protein PilX
MKLNVKSESGFALAAVVMLGTVLTILAVTLVTAAVSEEKRSAHGVWREAAFQAAEAGVDDYVSKLVDDRQYYVHQVHAGESTRTAPGGTAAAGTAWTLGNSWTYPSGKNAWRSLPNGYEYNLQVTPPSLATPFVRIVATGRKSGSTEDVRVIETFIRPTSLTDFYRVVNGDVGWGSGATTNGKIYANGDIDHDGTATADMYAEGNITGSYTLQNGAQTYDHSTIRTKLKNPINFSSFVTSFVDVQRAAQLSGIYLNDASKAAWRLRFLSNGTVEVKACTKHNSKDVAEVDPDPNGKCSAVAGSPFTVPANGAIYTSQTAIVMGTVNGRVTVASNVDIVVGGNIFYLDRSDDVLGLAATNNVTIAEYVPDDMEWSAGVLAQNGTWETYTQDGSHNNMVFRGSSATNLGGSLTMFQTRDYGYLAELQYLSPPWFPIIGDAYTVLLFRELPAAT